MVVESSKQPLKLSEKLDDVYKAQKNVKKACKSSCGMVLYVSAKR
jgi:hypothetical protein